MNRPVLPTPDTSGHLERGRHEIWWERFGDGTRPTVVLLNGLAMHTAAWHGFLDELRPELDVLLYDYLGQGRSSSPDEPFTIARLADDLAAILDRLAIDRVHPVGVSYGGFVALEFARLHTSRLSTLTLSGILLSQERQFELYQDLSLRFYDGGTELFELYTRYLYEKIFGEAFLRSVPEETLEEMRQRFHDRYRSRVHSLRRLTEAQNPFFEGLAATLPEYRAISTPTLLIVGAEDRAIPPWQQSPIAEVLPDVRVETIDGAGHVVYLENRERFFALLRAFLRTGETSFEDSPALGARPGA